MIKHIFALCATLVVATAPALAQTTPSTTAAPATSNNENGPKTSNVGTGGMSSMKGSSMKGSSMKSSSAKTKTKPAMKTKSTPAPK
jgi:uncharacterized protein involved in copper resistance